MTSGQIVKKYQRISSGGFRNFEKRGSNVGRTPILPHKWLNVWGSGGMLPQKIFGNIDTLRCILVHSGIWETVIFYAVYCTDN